jgi:hypothetical protein
MQRAAQRKITVPCVIGVLRQPHLPLGLEIDRPRHEVFCPDDVIGSDRGHLTKRRPNRVVQWI